jgi:hypothetical protein
MAVEAPAMALKAIRGLPDAISEKTNMQRQRIAISNPARPGRRVIASFMAIFRWARPHSFGRDVSFDGTSLNVGRAISTREVRSSSHMVAVHTRYR